MRAMSSDHADVDAQAHDPVADHPTDAHVDAHGHDEHGDDEELLGPIDRAAWGAGVLGVVIGLVMAMCFALATSSPG